MASGSDDGRWFIWVKKTGRLVKMLVGDEDGMFHVFANLQLLYLKMVLTDTVVQVTSCVIKLP